jgi:hypothetical protein
MYVWQAETGVSEVGIHKNEDLIKTRYLGLRILSLEPGIFVGIY